MSSVHEFISALSLPSDTIQKLEVWLYHPDNGWHPTDPVDEAFYAISDEHLVQAGLTTRERRSFLAKLKAAAGKRRTWSSCWESPTSNLLLGMGT